MTKLKDAFCSILDRFSVKENGEKLEEKKKERLMKDFKNLDGIFEELKYYERGFEFELSYGTDQVITGWFLGISDDMKVVYMDTSKTDTNDFPDDWRAYDYAVEEEDAIRFLNNVYSKKVELVKRTMDGEAYIQKVKDENIINGLNEYMFEFTILEDEDDSNCFQLQGAIYDMKNKNTSE